MTTTGASEAALTGRAMLDTNVFLSATDQSRAEHRQAMLILNDWAGRGTTLYASGQIMREYLAVATRPADKNGLGLKQADALANARAIRSRTSLLGEDAKVADRLLGLLDEIPCTGKQVHDANIVATMIEHGINTLVTINVADFSRFGQHITLIPLPNVN
jgi:predicted nucleic acid-binding protein